MSCGFWVATTMKGSGRSSVVPSTETWRSPIASSSADWVFGVARLTSSPMMMFVKTGPGWKRNYPEVASKIETPVTSVGSRSEVN